MNKEGEADSNKKRFVTMKRPSSVFCWQFKAEISNLMQWLLPIRTHKVWHQYNVSRQLPLVSGTSKLLYGYSSSSLGGGGPQ
eukprot:1279094-Ditylum_brightwellii.AAC.1